MPFIGLDWRSPGEHWIKTPTGSWERSKMLENSPPHPSFLSDVNHYLALRDAMNCSLPPLVSSGWIQNQEKVTGSYDSTVGVFASFVAAEGSETNACDGKENVGAMSVSSDITTKVCTETAGTSDETVEKCVGGVTPGCPTSKNTWNDGRPIASYQPHCHISKRSTRETNAHTSLADAFWRLDFPGAVRDLRRFNYVCKVLHVLISEKLSSLGGQAQKLLFNTFDHVVGQVISTQQNMHIIRLLMQDLNLAMEESRMIWGQHMGSTRLWEQHRQRLQDWNQLMAGLKIDERDDDGKVMLTDLPEECMRLILLCLSDHHDLMRSAEALKGSPDHMRKFGQIFDEQRLWRELCFFHFDARQLKEIMNGTETNVNKDGSVKKDWEDIYRRMKRLFGLRETYAETLHLCSHCRTLYWEPYGHPCPVMSTGLTNDNGRYSSRDVSAKVPIPVSPRAFLDLFSL